MATSRRDDAGKARVLLIDDHPIVRQGLARLVAQEPDLVVCGEASDPPAAMRAIDGTRPDLVVVDLSLSSGNGIELIKSIRSRFRDMRILVLTMHSEPLFAERALRAGADGFLTKQEASERVIDAMRALLRGENYVSEQLSPALLKRLIGGGEDRTASSVSRLSDRELEVFMLIGDGLSTQEIADKLNLSVKTIETYRAHIKEKLGLEDARKLVQYAIRWVITHRDG